MKPALHAYSAWRISERNLPGASAVIRIADESGLLPAIKDQVNARRVLDLVFEDRDGGERAPNEADAKRIAEFVREAEADRDTRHIVAQCQAGAGRSVAVCAAIAASRGGQWDNMLAYNRTLYKLILGEFGIAPTPEPRVSLAVRVKYDAETLMGFLISLRRQRYDNWEAVLFTDGHRPDIRQLVESFPGNQLILMETPESKGRWGHPYRQQALQVCLDNGAEWIGTNNDDNYLVPGYIEQMVMAGERGRASLVACHASHRYSGWGVCKAGQDLACWLARRELVQRTPWKDTDFWADEKYFNELNKAAGANMAEIPRVLVVKN